MQLKYHIHPDIHRMPSVQQDKLILDISFNHLGIAIIRDHQLVYLDLYTSQVADENAALDDISSILAEHEWLQTSFEMVKVFYHTHSSILVPDALFNPDNSDVLSEWQFGDVVHTISMKDSIAKESLQLLYAVPEALHHMLTANFPKAKYFHAHSALLMNKTEGESSHINIEVFPGEWTCSFWKNSKLQLVRSILPEAADDICYTLLHICNQFNLTPAETKISLAGLIDKDDPVIGLLSTLFNNISWKEMEGISNYPNHFFTPVFNQSLCEL